MMEEGKIFSRVALSYASEDKKFVEKVASELEKKGIPCFCFDTSAEDHLTEPLDEVLHKQFSPADVLIVVFLSNVYWKKYSSSPGLKQEQGYVLKRVRTRQKSVLVARLDEDVEVPDDIAGVIRLNLSTKRTGDLEKLTTAIERLVCVESDKKTDKKEEKISVQKDVEGFSKLAVFCAVRGDYKTVIDLLDKVIELSPHNEEAYFHRGLAKAKLGYHKEALPDYDKAIWLDPSPAGTYINRGLAKMMIGRLEEVLPGHNERLKEALQDYDKAIGIVPEFAGAYFERGALKAFMKQPHEAIEDLEKAKRYAIEQNKIELIVKINNLLDSLRNK